ncbi:MAG: PVC-type heme-binding CxxCH protein [Rubripirellula sp.]
MMIRSNRACILLWVVISLATEASLAQTNAEHSVSESHAALQVRAGYVVEPVASEPLVIDPVSARLDHQGRLWVVEMPDYPLGPPEGHEPSGRIKILRDTDADGRFDQATLFADKLVFATGVQPYRDGAFVTLAGQIVFMQDRDGDGVADETKVLFEGFAEQNQQLRANHPTLGPDGMIYVAGGLRGGTIQSMDDRFPRRESPVDLRDKDFRFDPEGTVWESIAGKSQFGVTIDDFGRRFGCSNRNPAMMTPLALEAIDRDPLLAARDAIHDVGLAAEKSKIVSIAQAWTTSNLHSGQFSAACGVFAPGIEDAQGEWLLACEPTAYLVQRQRLQPSGSVWRSDREADETEFLASRDSWFRAVDATAGPGRAVYIVDMARAVIEHPDFMPTELKTRPDLRLGNELGRIWRVQDAGENANLESLRSADQAIQWLRTDSPWKRQMASQYFMENLGGASQLKGLVLSDQESPRARARAGFLLQREGKLGDEELRVLLRASEPRLRSLAVQWARGRAALFDLVMSLAEDSNPMVLRHVAVVAGSGIDQTTARIQSLATIAAVDDHWTRQTVASVPLELVPQLASQLAVAKSVDTELLSHLTLRWAISDSKSAASVITAFSASREQRSIASDRVRLLEAWIAGVRKARNSIVGSINELPTDLRDALQREFTIAIETSTEESATGSLRAKCLQLSSDIGQLPKDLRKLVADNSPPEVRIAAIPILLRRDNAWTHDFLTENLTGLTIQLRSAAITACSRNVDDAKWLLTSIADGVFPKTIVDPATAKRLRQHSDPVVQSAANELFRSDPNRAKVIASYLESANQLGDPAIGKQLFTEHCSACHRIDGMGTNVGPDISDTRSKTSEALLTSILDPNAAIDSSFIQYNVLTLDGRIVDGLLIDETSEAITLQQKGGKRIAVAREEIDTLQAPGVSLMPEGFEQAIKPEAMSHLLSYLKNWRYMKTAIPGTLSQSN